MNLIIILFFTSLLAVSYMVGRKLFIVREANSLIGSDEMILIAPNLENIKYLATKKFKRYGYIVVLLTLRLSIKSSNYVKSAWQEMWRRIEEKFQGDKGAQEKEISKFLKAVSDYKRKLKNIRERVIEEEKVK